MADKPGYLDRLKLALRPTRVIVGGAGTASGGSAAPVATEPEHTDEPAAGPDGPAESGTKIEAAMGEHTPPPDDTNEEKEEEDTMAEPSKSGQTTTTNSGTTPATPADPKGAAVAAAAPAAAPKAATITELKAAFPAPEHRDFVLEAAEKGYTVSEAKAALFDKMQADGSARAAVTAALGGAGTTVNKGAAMPREAGAGGKIAPGAAAAGLMDPVNPGRYLPVPGAKTYQEALSGYLDAGLSLKDANRWAQHNHEPLWDEHKRTLAKGLEDKRAKNPRK